MPGPAWAERQCRTLPNGRQVSFLELGDPGGRPVLYCHGFPACAAEAGFARHAAVRAGVRLIAPDRPGYGYSAPLASERVADWPADAGDLLDALGVGAFAVLGMSGGAPYAVACAARFPRRVRGVATIGGLGPLDVLGAAGLSGLGRVSAALAVRSPRVQSALFTSLASLARARPESVFALFSAGNAAVDRRLLRRPELRRIWIEALRGCVRQGPAPATEEMRRYVRPWGVDWDAVEPRADLWHGRSDRVVAPGHSRYMAARLPRARLHLLPGEGHFSAPLGWIETVLERLVHGDVRWPDLRQS